jgi:uncharacterized membrane protein
MRANMSLESGRKLGITASLIEVIVPIAIIVTVVAFLFLLFTSALRSNVSWVIGGLIISSIALAVVGFVGIILFIVAMHHLAQYYNESTIFKNTLYGFILNIIGSVSYGIIYIFIILGTILQTIPRTGINTTAATPFPVPTVPPILNTFPLFFVGIIVAAIVLFVFTIVAAVLYYRAFNKLSEKSGISNFNTAGLLILIGTFVPIVGWIGWIFAERAFQSLKPKETSPQTTTFSSPQPLAPTMTEKKNCPYCGSENKTNAIYCSTCGKQLS